jgi:hypothetical protein
MTRLKLGCGGFKTFAIQVRESKGRAEGGQVPGDVSTDARGRPGNEINTLSHRPAVF